MHLFSHVGLADDVSGDLMSRVIVLMSLGRRASPEVSHIAAPGTEGAVQPGVCLLVEQAHEHPALRLP